MHTLGFFPHKCLKKDITAAILPDETSITFIWIDFDTKFNIKAVKEIFGNNFSYHGFANSKPNYIQNMLLLCCPTLICISW